MGKVIFIAFLLASPLLACLGEGLPSSCGDERAEISDRSRKRAESFRDEIYRGELGRRTTLALDAIIQLAAYKLHRAGHNDEAKSLIDEWNKNWRKTLILNYGIGDHAPLSNWLSEKYALLYFVLGANVMKWTRLDNLAILNFSIPVVFACIDKVDLKEYSAHYEPFLGVVGYWSSFFACTGFTWGSGFLFCGPISLGVEYISENFVAPRTVDFSHAWACQ